MHIFTFQLKPMYALQATMQLSIKAIKHLIGPYAGRNLMATALRPRPVS